eukprot:Gregarina_sp_Poly_1__7267@NODE_39_length_18147_cov_101_572069_g34_i0_p9_GENE_NODE_39_length_18147_cov_101_572069_g34_i0NODE_39_length_18147_cov_101_572069_g34_i0_p9_ORF_typecomplete_len282_score27_81FHA/PF00498_26/2_3e03FHA/PF00498_26/0_5_NODE_39_length_18147_cov_101_572069_g34_i01612516970
MVFRRASCIVAWLVCLGNPRADFFLVNRVDCYHSSCPATCQRYCATVQTQDSLSSCSRHLSLAHCFINLGVTERYLLNYTQQNVCFFTDTWLFELPSPLQFTAVDSVDLTFESFTTVSADHCPVNFNGSRRVSIFDVSETVKLMNSKSMPRGKVFLTQMPIQMKQMASPINATRSITDDWCLDAAGDKDLTASPARVIERRAMDVVKDQLMITGGTFHGSIETGHSVFVVRPETPCRIEGRGLQVQISGTKRVPLFSHHSPRLHRKGVLFAAMVGAGYLKW